MLGPGRTQLVKKDSSSILGSVEENRVAAYGAGNRNCVAVARTDDRNQICDDLRVLGEAAWLTEATGAAYRMIMPAGRHGIGVLKSDMSGDASGRSVELLELCGYFETVFCKTLAVALCGKEWEIGIRPRVYRLTGDSDC